MIAQKAPATKECGPGKLNKFFPKDSLLSMESTSPSSPSDLHLIASILLLLAVMIMFIIGLFTKNV